LSAGKTIDKDESPASHTCSDNGGIPHPSRLVNEVRRNGRADVEFIAALEDTKATV
jgi:hypothetical protein